MTSPSPAGRGRWQRGQATVELALVLPVVLMLTLTVVQVGLVVRDRLLVVHAAREAARAAAVEPTQGVARTGAEAAGGLDPTRLAVTMTGGAGAGTPSAGDRITVAVRYRSPTRVPLVGLLVPDVTVASEVTMRVE